MTDLDTRIRRWLARKAEHDAQLDGEDRTDALVEDADDAARLLRELLDGRSTA